MYTYTLVSYIMQGVKQKNNAHIYGVAVLLFTNTIGGAGFFRTTDCFVLKLVCIFELGSRSFV